MGLLAWILSYISGAFFLNKKKGYTFHKKKKKKERIFFTKRKGGGGPWGVAYVAQIFYLLFLSRLRLHMIRKYVHMRRGGGVGGGFAYIHSEGGDRGC